MNCRFNEHSSFTDIAIFLHTFSFPGGDGLIKEEPIDWDEVEEEEHEGIYYTLVSIYHLYFS